MQRPTAHPRLQRSYKGVFPFRLGTTSYIYPETYLPNAEKLSPYVDEIELLFFQGRDIEQLPDPAEMEALAALGRRTNLSYNVHLPTDVDLGHCDDATRREAVAVIQQVMERAAPLAATTHTLHLPWRPDQIPGTGSSGRLQRFEKSLAALIRRGISPRSLSIETLDYPFEWVAPLVDGFGLSVCLDMGHLLVHGRDPAGHFRRYGNDTAIIHLHGVKQGRDHLPLDQLPAEAWAPIASVLSRFRGTVSLEIFSFEHLAASLAFLEKALGVNGTALSPEPTVNGSSSCRRTE